MTEPKKLFPIIFLDFDGVLNCQTHYSEPRTLALGSKLNEKVNKAYYQWQLSRWRLKLLSDVCLRTGAKVVVSSSWRIGYPLEKLRQILRWGGATFEVLSVTPSRHFGNVVRGQEIKWWLEEHVPKLFGRRVVSDFKLYVILDDDSDMLLEQREQFFHVDGFGGLTPRLCYKIERYFNSFNNNAWTPPRQKKKRK